MSTLEEALFMPVEDARQEECRQIPTRGSDGANNGRVIELWKEGKKTTAYVTVTAPGQMKGFHLHQRRTCRFVPVRGRLTVILVSRGSKTNITLDSAHPQRLIVPPGICIGLKNTEKEEAWLLNLPIPAYDPDDDTEQLELSEAEIEILATAEPPIATVV
jgi:dTDP-4-dehydrorhamnose 3,5-epimerase-like enzyme